jgi:hypothetical protein
MHELILGIAFIAMVATPAMVATLGGKKESQPEPEEEPGSRQRSAGKPAAKVAAAPAVKAEPAAPTGHLIRPHSMYFAAKMSPAAAAFATPTLPVHGRGMVGR